MVLTVTKCLKLAESQYCERIDDWCHHVIFCNESVEGLLTIIFSEWILRDDLSSLKCIIIGDLPYVYNGKTIKLTPPYFNIIVEHFQAADDGSTAQTVYLNFDFQDVDFEGKMEHAVQAVSQKPCEKKPYSPLKMKGRNHLLSCSMYSVFPNSQRWKYNIKSNLNHTYHTKQMQNQGDGWNGRVCQKFIVQHKLPLIIYYGKNRMLFVLVTLVGGLSAGRKVWFACQDGDIQLNATMFVGKMYCLKLPFGVTEAIFFKKDNMSFLQKYLPEVPTLYLPKECIIFELNSAAVALRQLCENTDVYSVSQVITELCVNDYCSVEGYVEMRKLSKSCLTYGCNMVEFGIPGNCDLFLELCDVQINRKILVIVGNWNFRLYPYCLLPQATIRLTHVQKKLGSSGNCYCHTTPLTSIELIALNLSPVKRSRYDLWTTYSIPSSSVAVGNVISCVMDNYKILKLTLQTICPDCSHSVNSKGCTFIGCHSSSTATLTGKATIIMTSMFEKIIIYLAGEHVRILLGADEDMWHSLKNIVLFENTGMLTYEIYNKEKPETLHEQIFQTYCKTFPMFRFHVRCKRMSLGCFTNKENLASFFCEEIQRPGSESASCLYKVLEKNLTVFK